MLYRHYNSPKNAQKMRKCKANFQVAEQKAFLGKEMHWGGQKRRLISLGYVAGLHQNLSALSQLDPNPSLYYRDLRLPLAIMSTPPSNKQSPNKWKLKFRSVFSSSKSPSRNLEVQSTSTNVPPINSPSP